MKNNICCIFNLAPHYNAPIYKLMDQQLKCDFYIGDTVGTYINLMDYKELKGFKKVLKFIPLMGHFYWQKGGVSIAFLPYKQYIITGEPYCLSNWFILFFSKLLGKKTYLWTHGWYGNETKLKILVKKIFFKLATKVLLYGDYARNLMIDEGFNADKLVCIYNSLDYENQIEIGKGLSKTDVYQKHFKNDFPVVLYIGRIQNAKRIDLLVEAIYKLKYININCNLIIIGKDIDGNNLQSLIDNYSLNDCVWLFGACYEEKTIAELIYNANICVVPGDIGLTAMHSFVYGTPVITHDNFMKHGPEFEAIVPNLNGDFFIENSVDDLCAKIKKWILVEENQRDIIRLNCQKIIQERYNPFKQIETLKRVLNV